ncbi:MAG: hypothetical protein FJX76_11255 [Armatimonadetes bacterium]|nr:hypothetical protein [Armatimonadota bacterium]
MKRLLAFLVALLLTAPAGAAQVTVAQEIEVGRAGAAQFEKGVRLLGGEPLARIQRIGQRVAAATGRTDLPFTFKLVDAPEVNAISFPGGFIYVYRGFMDANPSDDELAGTLGHEVAHVVQRHVLRSQLMLNMQRRAFGRNDAAMRMMQG